AETIFIVEDYYSYGVKILRTEKSSTMMGSDAAGRGVRRGRACQQAAASARSTSAAWPAAACLYPVPAHRCTASGWPAAAAALRIGLVRWCRAGYPDGAIASYSSMNRLRMPRAGRPLNDRVSTVSFRERSAMAAWCAAEAPLSAVRSKAVPTMTACAPALMTSATCAGVASPPAAMTGSEVTSLIIATSAAVGTASGNRLGVSVAEWAPAAQ